MGDAHILVVWNTSRLFETKCDQLGPSGPFGTMLENFGPNGKPVCQILFSLHSHLSFVTNSFKIIAYTFQEITGNVGKIVNDRAKS